MFDIASFRFLRSAWFWCAVATCWMPPAAHAIPVFARQYGISCTTCHDAFPRLNAFGESFMRMNYRLPNWKEASTVETGDDRLALPKIPPLAIRAQAYVQDRQGEEIDPATGPTGNNSKLDFQAPYLIKLLSSAPLSDHMTYYFYGIFAEKGTNRETLIEDAWFRHDDIFDTKIGVTLGQFQISDLMFRRETRLPFQDFMVYRTAGITYDRGVLFDRDFGPVAAALGLVNGNGITDNFNIDSPGYRRPDRLFDNDRNKTVFGRIGTGMGPVSGGLFALAGKQKSITGTGTGTAGTGTRVTDKRAVGLDLLGDWNGNVHWYAQGLWNRWDGFRDEEPTRNYHWFGGFAGVDYVHDDRWTYSLLYNYAKADDFKNTGTVFEGIKMNTLTLAGSYYFMRNVKGVIEGNVDFLSKDSGPPYVGHQSKENYLLVGFDAAF